MFVMVQENRGPTLNMARSLINRPNGQVLFDSESESESGNKNVKKEKRQQKEQEKIVAKN